jgi:peptidyl-prolyl cis-trans isomerase SurA
MTRTRHRTAGLATTQRSGQFDASFPRQVIGGAHQSNLSKTPPPELSSRPERSVVERPAVRFFNIRCIVNALRTPGRCEDHTELQPCRTGSCWARKLLSAGARLQPCRLGSQLARALSLCVRNLPDRLQSRKGRLKVAQDGVLGALPPSSFAWRINPQLHLKPEQPAKHERYGLQPVRNWFKTEPALAAEGQPHPTHQFSRLLTIALLFLAALLTAAAQTPIPEGKPVVLDHVVAVINGSVILQSDVNEEMAYAVLQPFGLYGAADTPQRALQRLIDRALILQQMETAQTMTPPAPAEVQQSINQLRELIPECAHYQCKTEAGWHAFLQAKGLTEQEVRARWSQRLLLLSFIQSRFGAGVRITPAEIADYYNKTLVPQFQGKTVKPPTLAAVSPRIQEILLQQRVSSLLLDWLQSLKNEGSVSILDSAYGTVGTTGSGDEAGGQP